MAQRPETDNWRWSEQPSWSAQPTLIVGTPYTTVPPMIAITTAPYHHHLHHGFVYNTFDASETSNSAVSPAKPYLAERVVMDAASRTGHGLPGPPQETNHPSAKPHKLSPVIKSEPQLTEILKPREALAMVEGQGPDTEFSTGVDRVMKVIQQMHGGSEGGTSTTQSKAKSSRPNNSSAGGAISRKKSKAGANNTEPTDKPHACHRKKCHKRFSQITHLHIHDRAHTGERPHKCTFAGCDKRFTQKGNLRSHERRHLGERPFKCTFNGCTRAFPQKGNLAAHLETHYKRNSFSCILKSCGKSFSTKGNLKSHQNDYHKDELSDLERKFSKIGSVAEMTDADKKLWDYFLTVHNNSNKGIKGRGKECRVELLPNSGNTQSQYQLQSPIELQHAQFAMPQALASFSHFGMPRTNLGQEYLVTRGGHGYEVYDIDQASMSSGTITPTSSPGGLYDDNHHRGIPFHDRIY